MPIGNANIQMTIDAYKNFVTIVDCGSIQAAANKLLVAQPSLSNQLKNTEKTFGTKLLIRNTRPLELTEAGKLFYQKAKAICMLNTTLLEDINNNHLGFSGTLKISIPVGNSSVFFKKLFKSYIDTHPQVNFDLYELPSEFVIPNVLNGITEIGLIRSTIPNYQSMTVFPYEREDIYAVFKEDHFLNTCNDVLSIEDFKNIPLSIPFDCLDIVEAVFKQHHFFPNVSIITSPKTTAIEWARNYNTVALLPMHVDDLEEITDLKIKKIDHPMFYVDSSFIISKNFTLSQVAKDFLKAQNIFI